MTEFATLDQLAEAYTKKFNAGHSHPDKHFTVEQVKGICVDRMIRPAANYLYGIDSHIALVRGFGYVKTN